ncbi:MAG: acylphosphatase [Thermodesulfobacteriota bacterium]
MASKRVRVRIEGVVQGVYFRAHTEEEAIRLGLAGWVRNLPDSSVEALFEGREEAVARMVAWCHHGPARAMVRRVSVQEEPAREGLTGFTIRY